MDNIVKKLKSMKDASKVLNPPLVAILHHLRLVELSLIDTQFLIPISLIPLKLRGSLFALTFLEI
jgi:hypothetical protein